MSFAAAFHGLLAFVLAEVLAEDIWVKVVAQGGQLEVREAKQPQKVSSLL